MHGLRQRLVVREDVKFPPVQQVPEMPHTEVGGQQLVVESWVLQLSRIQLLAKKCQRSPTAAGVPLLEDRSYVCVTGIYSKVHLCRWVWMCQDSY